jgi:hypothetical protein
MAYSQMLTGTINMTPPPPSAIGDSYAGGYYAGQISVPTGVYNLVVSPKASGETTTMYPSPISGTSTWDGMANSVRGLAGSSGYWCTTRSIGGYTDWYLPAVYELGVIYYFLKPGTTLNRPYNLSSANPYAVSPQPINTQYTTTSPAQTSVTIFKTGGTEAFGEIYSGTNEFRYWSSTNNGPDVIYPYPYYYHYKTFTEGYDAAATGSYSGQYITRAIRKVPA